MSTLLEIKNLKGGYEEDVNILQGIDFSIAEGEAVGIIGLNGSGKSSLGKAIMNLLPYRSGSITFSGHSIVDKSTHELARMGITLMHQGGSVFPNLSVWDNIQLAGLDPQLRDIIPLLQESKKKLSLTTADKLSGGQRHELALAMTLARHPRLIILDEPSAGLSPSAVANAYSILHQIQTKYGITILLIEQNVSQAVKFCGRCLMLAQGVINKEFVNTDISEIDKMMFSTNN